MSASFKPVFVGGRRVISALALLATILLAGTAALAESPISKQTSDDRARGRRLFQGQCARCHGMDGAGGTGPALNRSVLGRAPDDQALFSVIKEGIGSTEMPAAWQMIDREIWQVAGYVRSLGRTARVRLPGEPERGKRFYGRGVHKKPEQTSHTAPADRKVGSRFSSLTSTVLNVNLRIG